MTAYGRDPKVSVVIPTYNRRELLHNTLLQLTRQSLPPDEFEVVVADDGSTDDTRAVVDQFRDRLRLAYSYQEDLGFRAGTARNAGARLATAPVLVFLDTGALASPRFLEHHLRLHEFPQRHRMAIGYCYGYNPDEPMEGIGEVLDRLTPEQTVAELGDLPAFRDLRHDSMLRCDFDLGRRAQPWSLTWTINCSIRADDFWAVDGFDDTFVGWGAEDLELAYRLHRNGVTFHFDRDAWVIETPHERNWDILEASFLRNMERFLDKHREPEIEIGVRLVAKFRVLDWSDCQGELLEWTRKAHGLDVSGEIAYALRNSEPGERVAVFGCGAAVPATVAPAVLLDFDRELLDAALADGRHTGYHAVGLLTPLPDQSVDTVVITSRLSGLRTEWNTDLLAEAHRIGRRVIDAGDW
ncbi:glycosyltransferase [Micromonospora sp. NPDC049523]|uniref:glycosyltransferase n=1 Tax=Micromonospora sp. NPDC049523 TaxID=3155921 RepID=UPI00343B72A3